MASRLDTLALVEPADRAEWRAWLAANGASSTGVWLAVGKKGNARTKLTYDDAVEEALAFGWIDSTVHRLDADRYRQLYTPRKPGSIWARSNKERVARLTDAGLMTDAGVAAVERARADGSWDILDQVEALLIPPDLADALADDEDAARGWDALPQSGRKQLLYWIMSAKRPQTRARRIAQTVEAAAEGRMPG